MQNQNKVYYIIQPPPQQNALAPLTSPGPLDFECQQTSPKVYIFLTNNSHRELFMTITIPVCNLDF